MSKTIYENIRKLASEKNLSITQVEHDSGIGNGTIGKWKAGKTNATFNTLNAISKTLGCTLSDLLYEVDNAES